MRTPVDDLPDAPAQGPRLTRARWVEAAMAMLNTHGVDGVRVEYLAKLLKVTKGSFYWHFKDRNELLEAMLDHWRQQNTIRIVETLGSLADPLEQLEKLLSMPFDLEGSDPFGLPLRLWARHDGRALRVLTEVDELRVRMMAQIFLARGFDPQEAKARAILLYSYTRVARTLAHLNDIETRTLCEDLLLRRNDQAIGRRGRAKPD